MASKHLFDQVYVSATLEDLEVFLAITEHPTLRYHVKKVICHAVGFQEAFTDKEIYMYAAEDHWRWLSRNSKNSFKPSDRVLEVGKRPEA